jgi:hypothetical protein
VNDEFYNVQSAASLTQAGIEPGALDTCRRRGKAISLMGLFDVKILNFYGDPGEITFAALLKDFRRK